MSESVGDRIAIIIKEKHLKNVEFANIIHIDQSYVSHLVLGKRKPSDRIIADICRKYGVNENWLRTGEGEMFRKSETIDEEITVLIKHLLDSDDIWAKKFIRDFLQLGPDGWHEVGKFFKRI